MVSRWLRIRHRTKLRYKYQQSPGSRFHFQQGSPNALKTVYANPFPAASSHCAVMRRPKAATKKKLATWMFAIVTPLHSIKLNESVVKVVAKAPIASALYLVVRSFILRCLFSACDSPQKLAVAGSCGAPPHLAQSDGVCCAHARPWTRSTCSGIQRYQT